jgi:glycosyltransferase involved in cell wall biosynthesis
MNPLKSLYKKIRQMAYNNCIDQHITISEYVYQRMIKVDHIPKNRLSLVYNGIDIDTFVPAVNIAEKKRYVFSAGYLREEKGMHVLLEALRILKADGLEVPCQIAGDGPRLAEYQAFVKMHELDQVAFLGLSNEIPRLVRDAALTVVPSVWPEAFCNVAAESLASGVPVIAADVGGLPEVVSHGVTGLVVPPGQPQALADAIRTLLSDPEQLQKMSIAAREQAVERFDLKKQSERIVEILTAR